MLYPFTGRSRLIPPMPDPSVSRRDFFTRGLFQALGRAADAIGPRMGERDLIRPPGALPEPAFLAACTRCGDCMTACPVGALIPVGGDHGLATGTPLLQPDVNACAMCADMPCARACPTGALEAPHDLWARVRLASIAIDESRCIATSRGVECGVCARVCPAGPNALRMDATGPTLGPACTGCGTCISSCVTLPSSIHLTS